MKDKKILLAVVINARHSFTILSIRHCQGLLAQGREREKEKKKKMKLKRTCLSDDSGNKSERKKPKTLEQLTHDNVCLLCRKNVQSVSAMK
jgi:hypothetical protein